MIPKVIHYCWFGKGKMSEEIRGYLSTGKEQNPDFKIIKWDETNFDINTCRFSKEAYAEKKYAFVSDYARLYILYHYGGIYLDVDMELKKGFDICLDNKVFLGYETAAGGIASCVMGAEKGTPLIKELLEVYENMPFILENGKLNMRPNTLVIEDFLKERHGDIWDGKEKNVDGIHVYDWHVFHPKSLVSGKTYAISDTIAVHHHTLLWVSWKTRLIKFIRIKIFVPIFGTKVYDLIEKRRKR